MFSIILPSMIYKMRVQPTSGDQPFIFERQKPRAYEKPEFTHIFADDPQKCWRQQKFSDVIWNIGVEFCSRDVGPYPCQISWPMAEWNSDFRVGVNLPPPSRMIESVHPFTNRVKGIGGGLNFSNFFLRLLLILKVQFKWWNILFTELKYLLPFRNGGYLCSAR